MKFLIGTTNFKLMGFNKDEINSGKFVKFIKWINFEKVKGCEVLVGMLAVKMLAVDVQKF